MSSITLRAGPRARALIAERGLNAADVSAIPAAAGGPKGLALVSLDKFLFGEWLRTPRRDARPRWLIGSSVGAWRMAAAAQQNPVTALERFRDSYLTQTYMKNASTDYVSRECWRTAGAVLGDAPQWNDDRRLVVVSVRGRGLLQKKGNAPRFAAAALVNAVSRRHLARCFERMLFLRQAQIHTDELDLLLPQDAFGGQMIELTDANARSALLASGSIPMIANAVSSPEGAPPGLYWDGGMVDYQLDWNWRSLPGLVLYPHYTDRVIPGWLDKNITWRHARGRHLENLLIVCPSPALLARLPQGRLPERKDFYYYGEDNAARIASWRQSLGECQRMVDDFSRFVADPDPSMVLPLLQARDA